MIHTFPTQLLLNLLEKREAINLSLNILRLKNKSAVDTENDLMAKNNDVKPTLTWILQNVDKS